MPAGAGAGGEHSFWSQAGDGLCSDCGRRAADHTDDGGQFQALLEHEREGCPALLAWNTCARFQRRESGGCLCLTRAHAAWVYKHTPQPAPG